MKEILAFYMDHCPYCKHAKQAIAELIEENRVYETVKITWVNDAEAAELYKTHPYNYVPNMWFDTELQYEAKPGETYEETKSKIKAVLDEALK